MVTEILLNALGAKMSGIKTTMASCALILLKHFLDIIIQSGKFLVLRIEVTSEKRVTWNIIKIYDVR